MLLSMTKGGKRIDNVWGSGGGQQSVKHLVKEVFHFKMQFFINRLYTNLDIFSIILVQEKTVLNDE